MSIINLYSLDQKNALLNSPDLAYGFEIASGLLEGGAKVWLCGSAETIEKTYVDFQKKGLDLEDYFIYEQGSEKSAISLIEDIEKNCGVLDIFVNNGPQCTGRGWHKDYSELDKNLRISQVGLMLTIKYIGLHMTESKGGSIIMITDYAALVGCDVDNYGKKSELFDIDFSLERGFISGSYINYARHAAGFLGLSNVRCNTIAFSPLSANVTEEFSIKFSEKTHLKRMIKPNEIKTAIIFLASDASSFITGITLPVDGGYTAK